MELSKNYRKLLWIPLAALFIFLAFNKHSRSKVYTYSSLIMSDKAGYYVYLPALFLYDFKSNQFPEKVDSLTGNGFYLNPITNKVESKYPVGTAILEAPFFLAAHTFQILTGGNEDGFNKSYQNFIDLAAIFYLLAGLFFLGQFLKRFFEPKLVFLSLAALLLGSNLFYYSFFEGAYSHVYSFFLFSAILEFLKRFSENPKRKNWLTLIALFCMVILVRQLNVVFIFICLFSIPKPFQLAKQRSLVDWALAIVLAILVLSPQILYNLYLSGSPLFYSYKNEGFIFWNHPKIMEVLVGFENGLISTNPLHLFTLGGIIILGKNNKKLALLALISFIVCTYIYASWWAYKLGCSYGHRGFVDIYPILAIALASSFKYVQNLPSKFGQIAFILIIIFLVAFNLKFMYTYDSCWPDSIEKSDFEIFIHFLTSPTK
ncbi:MAG: hypothetical protein K9H61_04115 [Bacteroidia bacterium]|nr:hypothetical protein [Bacteroidia bacterium]MCF8425898.1 hypothetical protein [Bacteroidia bacterium]MCF8446161.1 hypothetical protein [Bacteroidia bacterium]